jgi:dUTP pyrophosphatase
MREVRFTSLDPEIPAPNYARPGDAAVDLAAASEVILHHGGGRAVIPTAIAVALPEGTAGLVLSRSGLAANYGIACLNAPGLIDSGYRGEIKVILVNTDPTSDYVVRRGDRIAQLMVIDVTQVTLLRVTELDPTERGIGGFGHSGR